MNNALELELQGVSLHLKKNINKEIVARPFVKWAGGKSQLLKDLVLSMPQKFNDYIEPFVGGGALFFHLFSTGRLAGKKAILIDSNNDLINVYKVIKSSKKLKELVLELESDKYENDEDNYYKIRASKPSDSVEAAARILFLNRTCFNGLYRVNSKGQFNTPFGRYKNPRICDKENLEAVNIALKNATLVSGDFEETIEYAESGDFVYFDPPYQPISKTASFTAYTKDAFTSGDQARLSRLFFRLKEKGCHVLLSNSYSEKISVLYGSIDKNIVSVSAKRMINCNAEKRGLVKELLISSYSKG